MFLMMIGAVMVRYSEYIDSKFSMKGIPENYGCFCNTRLRSTVDMKML